MKIKADYITIVLNGEYQPKDMDGYTMVFNYNSEQGTNTLGKDFRNIVTNPKNIDEIVAFIKELYELEDSSE